MCHLTQNKNLRQYLWKKSQNRLQQNQKTVDSKSEHDTLDTLKKTDLPIAEDKTTDSKVSKEPEEKLMKDDASKLVSDELDSKWTWEPNRNLGRIFRTNA